MTNVVDINEWKKRKAAEHMVVPCGTGGKVQIQWTPQLTDEDRTRLKKAGQGFRTLLEEIRDAGKVQ